MNRTYHCGKLFEFGDFRIKGFLPHAKCDGGLNIWRLPDQYCADNENDIDIANRNLQTAISAFENPDSINAEVLKKGVRRSIYRANISGKLYVIKSFPLIRFKSKRKFKKYAYQEVVNAVKARGSGIATPGYYIYFEHKSYWMVNCCGVIIQDLKGFTELTTLIQEDQNALLFAIPILISLYQKGVNHIDITPSNIFVDSANPKSNYKIIDWKYCSFHPPFNSSQLIVLGSHFLNYAHLSPNIPMWKHWVSQLHLVSSTTMPLDYFIQTIAKLQKTKLTIKDRINLDAKGLGIK